jgi:outer membrane protein OmpA-like peptidoglycan-associated protein
MSGIEDAGKDALNKAAGIAGDGVDAAKNLAGNAADAVGDVAGAGVDAAKGALGAVGGLFGGLAGKAGDLVGGAVDAAKDAAGAVADKAGDLADGAVDAAKGAAGAVGGVVGNVADGVGNVADGAMDAAKGAAGAVGGAVGNVADGVGNLAGGAVDAAKGVFGGVGNVAGGAVGMAGDAAGKVGGAGIAAVGAGAAVLGGAAAGLGNLGKGAVGGVTNAVGLSGNTGASNRDDDGIAPLSARLADADERSRGPGFLLPLLGVLGLGALAYIGWQTIANGNGTLFPKRETAAVTAPAVAAPALPAWLSAIGDKLKATFPWLTLGASGTSVIANGEADTQEAKDNALKEVTLAVKAAPEGATTDVIDNITVKGTTTTPVGAALAALGANPTSAACNTAFATTMAGRTINFSTGGASIGGDNASLLNTLTAVANACKAHKIEVAGHTDSVGKPESNQALSQKRADAVKAYWTGKGVAAEGLVAKGYGETKPVEAVADETANEKNRRIDFAVTDAAAAPAVAVEPAK